MDPVERIADLTDGIGTDVVFEAAGGPQNDATTGSDPLAQAVKMLRPGGTIVQVGLITGDVTMSPGTMRSKNVRWINPAMGRLSNTPNMDTGQLAVRMVADGRVSIAELVTHEVEGIESFTEAIEITTNKHEYGARGPAQIVLQR
jgi:threonine dehydrogenase-like Zn-dependent dehydrogenase